MTLRMYILSNLVYSNVSIKDLLFQLKVQSHLPGVFGSKQSDQYYNVYIYTHTCTHVYVCT